MLCGVVVLSLSATVVDPPPPSPAVCTPSPEFTFVCTPRRDATDQAVAGALGYLCGAGVDCGPINAGGACYDPNTLPAHASWGYQKFYELKEAASPTIPAPGTCDFAQTAALVPTAGCGGPCKTSIDCMGRGKYCSHCLEGQCTYGNSCGGPCELDGDCYQADQGTSCKSCGADGTCKPTQ
eukprot:Hpha_TRINITY_DN11046_c0_g1::TRINITY_DN11046_c0_g1_i1::g.93032::m.93032